MSATTSTKTEPAPEQDPDAFGRITDGLTWRRARTTASTSTQYAERGAWWVLGLGFRHPVIAGAVLAGLPVLPAVTYIGEASGLGIVGAGVGIAALCGGARRRESVLSLLHSTKSARRRKQFRDAWPRIMHDAKLVKSAKVTGRERHPRLVRVRMVDLHHLLATVDMSTIATPPGDLQKVQGQIKAACRAKAVKVTPIDGHRAHVHVFWRDPLARTIRIADLPAAVRPIAPVVGFDDDGAPVVMDLTTPHLLIGEQGSGKSHLIHCMLDGLRRAEMPVRLRVMDPKGGMEFGMFADVAYEYEYDALGFASMLDHIVTAMRRRQASLRSSGVRNLTRFTLDNPLDVLVIDEFLAVATLLKRSDKVWKKAAEDMQYLLSQGRAAGFTVVAASQNGKLNVLGEGRDLFPNRTLLRVNSDSMISVVLNVDGAAGKYPAHEIERAGEGYYAEAGMPIRRFRSAYVIDPEIAVVVQWLRDTQQKRRTRQDQP